MLEPRYGRWTVLNPAQRGTMIDCVCDCGTQRAVRKDQLRYENSKSCGCLKSELLSGKTFPNLAPNQGKKIEPGEKFGRWTILETTQQGHDRTVRCQCECGTIKNVIVRHLGTRSKSCGCLRRQGAQQMRKET